MNKQQELAIKTLDILAKRFRSAGIYNASDLSTQAAARVWRTAAETVQRGGLRPEEQP